MAITNPSGLTLTAYTTGIPYSKVIDSSSEWTGISNSTYFYDKSTGLVSYKDSTGSLFGIFSSGGSSSSTFTGNTSASCITDLYVDNLYGCSAITINSNVELVSGVLFTDQTGLSVFDISNGSYNQYSFGVGSNQTNIYQDDSGVELYATYNGFSSNTEGTAGISVVRNGAGNWSNPVLIQGNYTNDVYQGSGPWNTAIFINATNSAILSGVTNTVILGSENITATTSNTTYVGNLNISNVGSGSSIINLGLDASGNVVTGTTGGGGVSKYATDFALTAYTASTITHNLGSTDVMVQMKDSTGSMIIPDTINNYQTNSVDITVTISDTYRIIIIG
jgi:hypothetical protein